MIIISDTSIKAVNHLLSYNFQIHMRAIKSKRPVSSDP